MRRDLEGRRSQEFI